MSLAGKSPGCASRHAFIAGLADRFIHGTVVRESFEVLDHDDSKHVLAGDAGEQVDLRDARFDKSFRQALDRLHELVELPGVAPRLRFRTPSTCMHLSLCGPVICRARTVPNLVTPCQLRSNPLSSRASSRRSIRSTPSRTKHRDSCGD